MSFIVWGLIYFLAFYGFCSIIASMIGTDDSGIKSTMVSFLANGDKQGFDDYTKYLDPKFADFKKQLEKINE